MRIQFTDFEHYFSQFSPEIVEKLASIRSLVHETVPEAEEVISYDMPAFKYRKRILIYFAAFKKHIGIRIPNCKLGAFFSDDHDFRFALGLHAQPAAIRNDFLRHLCLCDFKAFATGICTDKICGIKQSVVAIMLPYAVNYHNAPPI